LQVLEPREITATGALDGLASWITVEKVMDAIMAQLGALAVRAR